MREEIVATTSKLAKLEAAKAQTEKENAHQEAVK